MTTLARPVFCLGGEQKQQQRREPPSHRSRKRRRDEIATAAATFIVSTAVVVAASMLSSASASTGGYLFYPRSRNYIAYNSSHIVPSATRPESILPEEEPTPQNVSAGQRCGVTDGSERDYNRPMSRASVLLPLNIQEVYLSGSEIEVTVNLFGVEGGGHFEFHVCALEHPSEPTEECFQQHPLTFVKDHYYDAVKDEVHPERAYLPFEQAFEKFGNSLKPIESEDDGFGSMIEFKYTFQLPESADLWTDLDTLGIQEFTHSNATTIPTTTSQTPPTEDNINADEEDESSSRFKGKIQVSGSTGSGAVLISAMVTDGKGKTTMVSMYETPIITENGPVVEASAICTFGDASIYGQGITNIPENVKTICGSIEETPPIEASSQGSDSDGDASAIGSVGDPSTSTFPSIKYALLRWHYQTARDCYPAGYDTYTWPETWGPWQLQWGGECGGDEAQTEYWNCAEVLILNAPDTDVSNEPPTAIKDIFIVDTNEEAQLDVIANDVESDEGDSLHVGSVTSPTHGILRISQDGSAVIYVPDVDYVGLDSFEYSACDSRNLCDAARVDIQVGPTMEFVFAKDDEAETTGTEPVFVNVLENDIVRVDNWPLFIVGAPRDGRHGNCTVTPDNWILYKADPGYEGRDRCAYKACITSDICDTGDVYIEVKSNIVKQDVIVIVQQGDIAVPTSRPTSIYNITAVSDGAITGVNQPIQIDVLANDEIYGNVKAKIKDANGASNGDCQVLDNEVLYAPDLEFIGWDRCSYTVCIGNDVCDEAFVKIKVLANVVPDIPANLDPVVKPDDAFVVEGSSVSIDVLENDEDPDGDSLVISSVSSPLHGSVEVVNNLVRYTSTTGFTGTDAFKYSACDRANRCDSAGVIVTVTAEVLAEDDSVTTISAPILIDVTVNDRSSSGQASLIVTNVSDGNHGSCSITASNKVKYIPDNGYSGWDRCDYDVCSGSLCDQGRVEINVLPPPSPNESMQEASTQVELEKVYAQDDHAVTFVDETIEVDVVSNDFVKGMDTLSITHTGGSENGKCEITINNMILYIPKGGFVGSDNCGYIICHDSNMCDEGILRIDVIQKEARSSLPLSASTLRSGINLTPAKHEISFADGTIITPASADATITTEFPDGNFGDVPTLFVSSESSSAGRRDAMLKFDTSSIDESACSYGIESATVSIYSLAYASDGGTVISTSNKFWVEMEVTWNDAPSGDGIVINDMGSMEVNTWYDIDVSSAVTLGEPLSIRIISHAGGESIALYASSDHADESLHPVLKIKCLC